MNFDSWGTIIDPTLNLAINHVLHLFVTAASKSDNTGSFLDNNLKVDWMAIYKDPDPPEHEYIIISAKDSLEDDKQRMFIVDRVVSKLDRDVKQTRAKGIVKEQAGSYGLFEGPSSLLSPSHSVATLSSMEEGQLTFSSSTVYPPIVFPEPQQSLGDIVSLSATKASQVVCESLDKVGDTRMNALDRVLGESYTIQSRYSKGQKALHFRPNSLTFFELMILAQVVHEFAPQYSTLEKNCFWFCNMVFDACRVIFGQRSGDDDSPQLHHLEILGRWNGLKVNQTTKQELRVIVYKFKSTYSQLIGEVRIVFQFTILY